MYKRLFLLSNFILIINLQLVFSQNTFYKIFEKDHFDYTSGIRESSNEDFFLLSSSSNFERVVKLDKFGNLSWDKNISPDAENKCYLEIKKGSYFLAGYKTIFKEQPYINISRFRLINDDGVSIKDSTFRFDNDSVAGIIDAIKLADKNQICALVYSGQRWNKNLSLKLLFIDFLGGVKYCNSIPVSFNFSSAKIFRRSTKDEYFVFGGKSIIRIDSSGSMIDMISGVPDENYIIKSTCQFSDGRFVSLGTSTFGASCLIYYDENGVMIDFPTINFDLQKHFNAISVTKDQGVILAGSHLLLLDSLKRQVWISGLFHKDSSEVISIAQSIDGGFYGCGHTGPLFRFGAYDLFAFKTAADGRMTGLDESMSRTLNVEISPNPSYGLLRLGGDFSSSNLTLTNLIGQQVLQENDVKPGSILDVSCLSNGIYVVSLSSGNATYVQKINIINY